MTRRAGTIEATRGFVLSWGKGRRHSLLFLLTIVVLGEGDQLLLLLVLLSLAGRHCCVGVGDVKRVGGAGDSNWASGKLPILQQGPGMVWEGNG